MAQGFSLKDQLFNQAKVRYLAGLFAAGDPGFDAPSFEARVMERLPSLELKQRITWISEVLGAALPGTLPDIAPRLLAALPPPLDPSRSDDDFGDFIFAPLGELVVARGLEDHLHLSLDLLEQITQRFSMEWAIRPFLIRWPDAVLAHMDSWVTHDSYHVRRLVSEGTRPRLPWGQGIGLPIDATLPFLDRLHGDPTRYVTRSVANHLNDVTLKAPGLAMDRLEDWASAGQQDPAELAWMTRHALRGLVRAGDPRAMALLGFEPDAQIDIQAFEIPSQVRIGDMLEISATISAPRATGAMVDYVFWRRRKDGNLSRKVFKLKQVQLGAGETVVLRKNHRLKPDATTFRLHAGVSRIELQVNGRIRAGSDVTLLPR